MHETSEATAKTLPAELAELRRQVREIDLRTRRLTADLDDEQARWQPAPERWSIAHCCEHLNIIGGVYLPLLDRAIEDARARGLTGTGPFRRGLFGSYLVRSMEPPPRRRLRAPKSYAPALADPPERIFAAFGRLQDDLVARIEAADGLHLRRIRFSSPILPLLRLSLGDWLAFLLAHERRHLWQAEQVRAADGFPARS